MCVCVHSINRIKSCIENSTEYAGICDVFPLVFGMENFMFELHRMDLYILNCIFSHCVSCLFSVHRSLQHGQSLKASDT